MTKIKPYADKSGEVREPTEDDLRFARRGRPPIPAKRRKRQVNMTLDPEVIERLKIRGPMSTEANALLRKALGL